MNIQSKPFLKWAGGKRQLISEIEKFYPFESNEITKYVEPFVGGGAVLFDILNKFELKEVYINDLNQDLINTYCVIRDEVDSLILVLDVLQKEFLSLSVENRKEYYYKIREHFNRLQLDGTKEVNIEKAALMIFLNKTCFNGLFRVNKKGKFNVPMGSYKNPMICDKDNLKIVSKKLQKVIIMNKDYKDTINLIDGNTFVYIDPPYRPISNTSNFTTYTDSSFNDNNQQELKIFIDRANSNGAKILVSNSDTKDGFFEELYKDYKIKKVQANRMINSNGNKRHKIKEILISNY